MVKLALLATGMNTSVGLNGPTACAAIRCNIDNNQETRFMDKGGEWFIGAMVPLEKPWRGLAKMVHLAIPPISECLAAIKNTRTEDIPLLLCVAEKNRPGRLEGLDDELLPLLVRRMSGEKLVEHARRVSVVTVGEIGIELHEGDVPLGIGDADDGLVEVVEELLVLVLRVQRLNLRRYQRTRNSSLPALCRLLLCGWRRCRKDKGNRRWWSIPYLCCRKNSHNSLRPGPEALFHILANL